MKTERELLEDVVGLFRGGYSPTSIAGELVPDDHPDDPWRDLTETEIEALESDTAGKYQPGDVIANEGALLDDGAPNALEQREAEAINAMAPLVDDEPVLNPGDTAEELDAFEDAPADIARRHADAALRAIAEAEGQVLPAQRMEDQPCRDTIVTLLAALRHVCDERGFAYGYLDAEGQHLYLSDKRWPL